MRVAPLLVAMLTRWPADSGPALGDYSGTYAWPSQGIACLQPWEEFTGSPHLTAFDESGQARTLYRISGDRFFGGPAIADSSSVESTITFQRDRAAKIESLTWSTTGASARDYGIAVQRAGPL